MPNESLKELRNISKVKIPFFGLRKQMMSKYCSIVKQADKYVLQFEKAKSLFKQGKFSESLELFHALIRENPNDAVYITYRARVFSRLGEYVKSLKDFDKLIEESPYDTSLISDRAVVLHLLARNEEALSELDRALNLDPSNPYRYSSRAYLKDRIGDLEGAIEDYEKAIELDPEDAISFNNKGLVEEKMGYISRSKKSFKQSDELIGYTPVQNKDISGSDNGNSKAGPSWEDADQNQKNGLTFSSFFNVLNGLATNEEVRKDFFLFIRKTFKGF